MKTASTRTSTPSVQKNRFAFNSELREFRSKNYEGVTPRYLQLMPYEKKRSIIAELRRQRPQFIYDTGIEWLLSELINYRLSVHGVPFWERFELTYPKIIV